MSLFGWSSLPLLWAQAGAMGAPTASSGSTSVLMLALRRWCSSLTLAPYDTASSWHGLGALAAGFGILIVVVACFQKPGTMFRQLFDLPSHFRLFSAAMARLRTATRLVGIVVGLTVLCWSTNQAIFYNAPSGRDDLMILLKGRLPSFLALEHGFLAALTPIRDIGLLGNLIPLLACGTVVLFQFTSDRYSNVHQILSPRASRDSFWGTVAWGSMGLYATYRLLSLIYVSGELPLGLGILVEVAFVPVLMAIADGAVLAWVLVELRNAGLAEPVQENLDLGGLIALLPATILACLLVMPARYMSTAVALAFPYFPTPSVSYTGQVISPSSFWNNITLYVRVILSSGILVLQTCSLAALGLIGATAWCKGTWWSGLMGWRSVLRAEGGRLIALTLSCSLIAGVLSTFSYLLLLAIPNQPWVLNAADAYAHFCTLPVGLLLTAGLVELGQRTLPLARVASANEEAVAVGSNLSDVATASEDICVG